MEASDTSLWQASRIRSALLAVLLAGCSVAPPTGNASTIAVVDWLASVADVGQFLPDTMPCRSFGRGPAVFGFPDETVRMTAQCARDFVSHPGSGRFPKESVSVVDHGRGGIPPELLHRSGEMPAIQGAKVWMREAQPPYTFSEEWTAVVDERFVVKASTEALLRTALERRGSSVRHVAADLPAIPATATLLMLLDGSEQVFPCPIVAVTVGEPFRVMVWVADRTEAERLPRTLFRTWSVAAADCPGGWTQLTFHPPAEDEAPESSAGLYLVLLSGYVFAL